MMPPGPLEPGARQAAHTGGITGLIVTAMQERRPGPESEEAGTGSPLSWQRRGGSNVALYDFSRGFL